MLSSCLPVSEPSAHECSTDNEMHHRCEERHSWTAQEVAHESPYLGPTGSSLPKPFDLLTDPFEPQVSEPQLGRGGLGLVPRKTAVLLIEVQNEFMTPGGKLHESVRPVMDQINMMSNCLRLCNELSK